MSATDLFPQATDHTVTYATTLHIRGVIVGGIPSDPSVIRSWLTARLGLGDPRLEEIATQTIAERDQILTVEDKIDLIMQSEAAPNINGFRRDPDTSELCIEGRIIKAMLKESANSAYPGNDFPGKTAFPKNFRKGLMATLAERVFIPERLIGLGVKEPTRIEERIKHVMTPRGPISAINRVEVVEVPILDFTVRVHDDFLPPEAWGRLWVRAEDIGLGADRGRSDGTFDLIRFERV